MPRARSAMQEKKKGYTSSAIPAKGWRGRCLFMQLLWTLIILIGYFCWVDWALLPLSTWWQAWVLAVAGNCKFPVHQPCFATAPTVGLSKVSKSLKPCRPSNSTGWSPLISCELEGPQDLSMRSHRTVSHPPCWLYLLCQRYLMPLTWFSDVHHRRRWSNVWEWRSTRRYGCIPHPFVPEVSYDSSASDKSLCSGVKPVVLGALSPMLFDAGWWGLGPLHFVCAGHYPPSNYGPTYPSLVVPDLNTLVDSLLHQMHLMPLMWFNGAHHRWRKTWGGHSLPASIMLLKWSPGSKIYGVPSSTIELLQGFLATWDSLAGRGCLCRGMEQYGFTVIGVAIAAPSIRYL